MNAPEPPPTPNDSTPIWDLVISDMRERDWLARAEYGTPLQASNGRDALLDAYQEALDLCVYLRQAIEEQRQVRHRWQAIEEQRQARHAAASGAEGSPKP